MAALDSGVVSSPASGRQRSTRGQQWPAHPAVLLLGWLVAHAIPVAWIRATGESTGDIHYYFRGVAGLEPGAMDEYPEVGTWPARLVDIIATRLPGEDTGALFIDGFIALNLLASAAFTVCLWRIDRHRRARAAWFWILFAAVSGPILLTRLDMFPGVLVAGFAVLLFSRSAPGRALSPALLAAATMMKLWPGILGAALVGGLRRVGTWARVAWFFGTLAALCVLVVVLGGTERLLSPVTYQGDRGLQVESILATPLMLANAVRGGADTPWAIGFADSKSYEITGPGVEAMLTAGTVLMVLTVVLALGWALVRLVRDDWTPVRALSFGMLLIMLVIVTNKVFSPQYMVWIAPVAAVAMVVCRQRAVTVIAVQVLVTAALTTWVYPVVYDPYLISNPPDTGAALVLVLRNVSVIVLTVSCAWWAFSPRGARTWGLDPGQPQARGAGAASVG